MGEEAALSGHFEHDPDAATNEPGVVAVRSTAVLSAERLADLRDAARRMAAQVLADLDFTVAADGCWDGSITVEEPSGTARALPVRVSLPDSFPDALPQVFTVTGTLPASLEHVEAEGRVCIAPASGILLDTSRPDAIVRDALTRAARALSDALCGRTATDLTTEFIAYWQHGATSNVWSIVRTTPSDTAAGRRLYYARLTRPGVSGAPMYLLADTPGQAAQWATHAGLVQARMGEPAYFLPLATSIVAPALNATATTGEWLAVLKRAAGPNHWSEWQAWLRDVRLPVLLAFSVPMLGSSVAALGVIRLASATGDRRKKARHGFRDGHIPAWRDIKFANDNGLVRCAVTRLDADYLTLRGGAMSLADKRVVLIGCGAAGSHIAMHVAALGVGVLELVDPDQLAAENVHRHVLGAHEIGLKKATALAEQLQRHYPHQTIKVGSSRVDLQACKLEYSIVSPK